MVGALIYQINPELFSRTQEKSEGKLDQSISISPNDTLNNHIDTPNTNNVSKNNALVTLVKDSTTIDTTEIYYEVIGTAQDTKKSADAYIARVKKRGFQAKIAKMPGKYFKVSLGTFMNPKSAIKLRDSAQKLFKDTTIYIKPISPKKPKK